MDIAGSFATLIDKCLIDPIFQRINILTNSSDNVREMQEKVRELKAARNDKRHELGQAENVGHVMTDKARNWFEVVSETEMEATGVEERHQRTCAWGLCVNCWSLYKLSKKSIDLKQKAGDMLNQQFDFAKRPLPKSVIEIESEPTENLPPSTQNMLQKMLDGLGDPKTRIIGVYGMGGVGKTTLAEKVNNHFKENSCFETVIMVTVSATPDISRIQTRIGKRLGLDLPEGHDVDDAREKLQDALRKKNFLLILDDVWDRLELKGIGIPHPRNHKGSKILITSRNKGTCTHMDAEIKLKVNPLSRDESWNLFVKKAGLYVTANRIKCFAQTVVEKCKGLPLAIVTVARAMADRDGVGEWADAVREMETSAADLRGMKEEVFVPLKFSFDKLEDDMLRDLFLYCVCFGEDSDIFENYILDYCVGEGLVDKLGSLMAVRNKGAAMIKSLKIASMLEDGEYECTVRMHDMMRELALWITSLGSDGSPKFLTRAGGFKEAPHTKEWLDATRISQINTQIEKLPEIGERCPKLTTLLLRNNKILTIVPQTNFLEHMDNLRVFDLSYLSKLEYLPDSLSGLVNLRVLRLRGCSRLRALPALGMLRHLQVLDLYYCQMLDQQILVSKCFDSSNKSSDLSNLRYLDVSRTKVSIPAGVISHHLLKLEDFYLYGARNIKWRKGDEGNNKEEKRSGLSSDEAHHQPSIIDVDELSSLTHLTSLRICLKDITISDWFKPLAKKVTGLLLERCTFKIQDAIQAPYESQILMWLVIKQCQGLTCVPCRVIQYLEIYNCEDLEVLDGAKEAYQESSESLELLILKRLPKLGSICVGLAPLNFFGRLSSLTIEECNRLNMLFTKGMPHLFNNLKDITVANCDGMEVIIEAEEADWELEENNNNGVFSPFPILRKLFLHNLQALVDVCSNHILHCPLITEVEVWNCSRLKKDPLHIRNADGLLVMEDGSPWWKGKVVEEEIQMI